MSGGDRDGQPLVTEAQLRALPKADLHCHLDGSLRLSTMLELAAQQGLELPATTEEGLAQVLQPGERCRSLDDYLRAFDVTLSVLQTADALRRVACELALDAAAENVRYLEVRFSPALNVQQGLALPEVMDAVLAGLTQAERQARIRCRVIVCAIRSLGLRHSLELAELCVAYRGRGVVGFDLAGSERQFPAEQHREAYDRVHRAGMGCTVHAGEAAGPESIAQALDALGAHRIGHGTRLPEDPALLARVRERAVPLEVCLSSNVQTRAAESLALHPLRRFLAAGLCVTINTDNRLITDTTVSRELWLAHQELGLSLAEIFDLVRAGFRAAFLPKEEKQELAAAAERELATVASA